MKTQYACVLWIALISAGALPETAQPFEDRCASDLAWDFLDLEGNGRVLPIQDTSCPPGYGPDVLHIEGGLVFGMPKQFSFREGVLAVLYREDDPRGMDADGVLLFGADYPMDVSVAHNVKLQAAHLWLEQDNDTGFQIRAIDVRGNETTLAERAGYGIVSDAWNKTRWIWQKVRVHDGRVQAKYWPAQCPEPPDWAIETPCQLPGVRCGIKLNSGDIHLAYFAAARDDIRITAPSAYLLFPYDRVADPRSAELLFFTNAVQAARQTFALSVTAQDKVLAETPLTLDIPEGHGAFAIRLASAEAGDGRVDAALSQELPAGVIRVRLSGGGAFDAQHDFDVLPVPELRARFDAMDKVVGALDAFFIVAPQEVRATADVRVVRDAARAHLDHAQELLSAGNVAGAEMSARFAAEALAELKGFKGAILRARGAALDTDALPEVPADDQYRTPSEQGVADSYSPAYRLHFRAVESAAASLVMGGRYEMAIAWEADGAPPEKDFVFRARLVSPLGNRVVAECAAAPDVPSSQWREGQTYVQRIVFDVLPESRSAPGQPQGAPLVLDEYHRLLLTVSDPDTGANVILGNPPGPQPDRCGQSYWARDFYVSSAPLEIRAFGPQAETRAGESRTERFLVHNGGGQPREVQVLLTAEAADERPLWSGTERIRLGAGDETKLAFALTPRTAGETLLRVRIIDEGRVVTEAKRSVRVQLPEGCAVSIAKANRTEARGNTFVTPLTVDAGGRPFRAEVFASGRRVGSGVSSGDTLTIEAEPWFGYYDAAVDFDDFRYEQRLVATVVETRGMDLLVNGEPFIVKGVNVHGMDPLSPARTAEMMRIMRGLGFNVWRGDYPARWQVDLAYELNTAYTVLAPYSCTSTAKIFGRGQGPPMATSRELTRLFAERYQDSAGVLLWNSCNEIDGENVDFLLSQYPVYKAFDPYTRPVHYANLYGQDLYQGQDVMGINTYFGFNQTAASKQPVVQRSIDLAREHGLPVMFCEFNSFVGAVHSTGADGMHGLFAWGVAQGMSGGVQYMRFDCTSHPGVFDDGYNTHKIYDDAIREAFADAEVTAGGIEAGAVKLHIQNKRRCTLRQVRLSLRCCGEPVPAIKLPDLAPQTESEAFVPIPPTAAGNAITVEGNLEFVTHFGFQSKAEVLVVQNAV